jgi:heat shock protein HslJ
MLAQHCSRLGSGHLPTCWPAGPPRPHQQRLDRRARQQQQQQQCHAASGAGAVPEQPQEPSLAVQEQQQQSVFGKIKAWFGQGKLDKQKLAEYGLGAFAGVWCAPDNVQHVFHAQQTVRLDTMPATSGALIQSVFTPQHGTTVHRASCQSQCHSRSTHHATQAAAPACFITTDTPCSLPPSGWAPP